MRPKQARITNRTALVSHGQVAGRQDALEIIEAGLRAADPYPMVGRLLRIEGHLLHVGAPKFQPAGSPQSAEQVYDLAQLRGIWVFGAGKGVQRVALALEDLLGDHLLGGQVIDKKGGPVELRRIGVTLGGHPVPDEDCVRGCERILALSRELTARDLVFTIGASGFSSLLTLPVPGISLEDIQAVVRLMQMDHGAPTDDLSPVRNHLDQLKGGRLTAYLAPAQVVHLLAKDPSTYEALVHQNTWVHTLPDCSTYANAVGSLKKWGAWDQAPEAVRRALQIADPTYETLKPEAFERLEHAIYGLLPGQQGYWPGAMRRAEALGYRAVNLATKLDAEASEAGRVMAGIALACWEHGEPFEPPVALVMGGELRVTVGNAQGIGGRNQEFALAAAECIAGCEGIVVGAVDSEGTDDPVGARRNGRPLPNMAGALADGTTLAEAAALGLDLRAALMQHDATPLLHQLNSGIIATQSTGLCDLQVILVSKRGKRR